MIDLIVETTNMWMETKLIKDLVLLLDKVILVLK